jgi:hypothetical protein
MDNNVTVGNLKNLVTDKPSPITLKLAQTKGDGSNAFALMDNNVTVGNLKNLVTDKPSPITLKLAQTKGDGSNAFALMDNNVTVGNLKNLVTDKPSPITLKLSQLEKEDKAKAATSPVKQPRIITAQMLHQCGCKVVKTYGKVDGDVTTGDVECAATDKSVRDKTGNDCKLDGFNVSIQALKNIVTDKPAPITMPLTAAQKK